MQARGAWAHTAETEIVTLIPHKVFTDKKEIGKDQRYAQEFL